MAIENYISGSWNVICDMCGKKKKNFQCTLVMNKEDQNRFVCSDTCVDKHQQQTDLIGIPDIQAVPLVRPGDGYDVTASQATPLSAGTAPLNSITGPNQPNS